MQLQMLCYKLLKKIFITGLLIVVTVPHDYSKRYISIDGKSLRGSYAREKGLKNLHLVTAWASEQRLVLGQVKVEAHSHEITVIPALLELIDMAGGIILFVPVGADGRR